MGLDLTDMQAKENDWSQSEAMVSAASADSDSGAADPSLSNVGRRVLWLSGRVDSAGAVVLALWSDMSMEVIWSNLEVCPLDYRLDKRYRALNHRLTREVGRLPSR